MKIIDKHEFKHDGIYTEMIKDGAVFIYPTDTIYGIGCDATNFEAVSKIRSIKKRDKEPFSVIASKEWIRANCVVSNVAEEWIAKLPGPYTLVFKLKDANCVASNVSFGSTIGVRVPDHWLKFDFPIVTTSVNVHGEAYMSDITLLSKDISSNVSFAIIEGVKKGKPSTIVNLESDVVVVNHRT